MPLTIADAAEYARKEKKYLNDITDAQLKGWGELVNMSRELEKKATRAYMFNGTLKYEYVYIDRQGTEHRYSNFRTQFWEEIMQGVFKVMSYSWIKKLCQVIDAYDEIDAKKNREQWEDIWYADFVVHHRLEGAEAVIRHMNKLKKWAKEGYPEETRPTLEPKRNPKKRVYIDGNNSDDAVMEKEPEQGVTAEDMKTLQHRQDVLVDNTQKALFINGKRVVDFVKSLVAKAKTKTRNEIDGRLETRFYCAGDWQKAHTNDEFGLPGHDLVFVPATKPLWVRTATDFHKRFIAPVLGGYDNYRILARIVEVATKAKKLDYEEMWYRDCMTVTRLMKPNPAEQHLSALKKWATTGCMGPPPDPYFCVKTKRNMRHRDITVRETSLRSSVQEKCGAAGRTPEEEFVEEEQMDQSAAEKYCKTCGLVHRSETLCARCGIKLYLLDP